MAGLLILTFIAIPVFASPIDEKNYSVSNSTRWIIVDPIGDRELGETFNITGTTNLEVGTEVRVMISALVRCPGHWSCPEFPAYGTLGTTRVIKGDKGLNKTYFFVNASDFIVENYYVRIDAGSDVFGDGNFQCTGPLNPFVTIDPIGNRTKGEIFYINGTTNIQISNVSWILQISKRGSYPNYASKEEYARLTVVPITSEIPGTHRWSANATDAVTELMSGEYTVLSGVNRIAATTENFTLQSNVTDPSMVREAPISIVSRDSSPIKSSQTKSSGHSVIITTISLCAALIFYRISFR